MLVYLLMLLLQLLLAWSCPHLHGASRLPRAAHTHMLSLAKCDSFMWQFVCLFAFGSLWPVGLSVVAS